MRATPRDREDFGAQLSFDRGAPGRRAVDVPRWEGEATPLPDARLLRDELRLPELSQGGLVRYYTAMSARNYGIDSGAYPLGSCTMKYNPKVDDLLASLAGFANAHPLDDEASVQGTLRTLHEVQAALAALTGLPGVSLAPAAGAQGELAGILMVKRALEDRGELATRRRVLVPDSAHGTNPATAAMAGFAVTQIPDGRRWLDGPSGPRNRARRLRRRDHGHAPEHARGSGSAASRRSRASSTTPAPTSTATARTSTRSWGRIRFGDLGFDVAHLNLHKSFSTPHGGGGPGAGPVCCSEELAPYLPAPTVDGGADGAFRLATPERSIGRLQQFHGNVGVLIRAYAYLRALGLEGLRAVSEHAVLNANYLRALLHSHYDLPYDRPVLHEVVFAGTRQRREHGVRTYDIAKRLIDHGFHPPTVYFPLIVEEALMIEPTETESREAIEAFAEALIAIAAEAATDPEALRGAPWSAPLGRLDEATAARRPVLRWQPSDAG